MLANKHMQILATCSNKKWSGTILWKSAKNCFATNQAYYETTAFFLHHNCIYSPVVFLHVLYKWQEWLFTSLNIFSRPFYLLENVAIFSTNVRPSGFLTFVLTLSTGDGKGQVIRATFSHNQSRNIVALQVEKGCCLYYHLRSQLVTQQISMLQVVVTSPSKLFTR